MFNGIETQQENQCLKAQMAILLQENHSLKANNTVLRTKLAETHSVHQNLLEQMKLMCPKLIGRF